MKNDVNDLRKGISGLLWLSANTGFIYVIQLVILFFLARLLSPAEFGEVATILILVGLAELFWQLGVGPAIIQKIELQEDDIKTAQTISVCFGVIIFVIINCFAPFWCMVFNIDEVLMLRAYSFVFILNSVSAISQSLHQKYYKFKIISVVRSVVTIIYGLAAIIFAFSGLGAWSLVWATVIKTAFQSLAFYISEPVSLRFHINLQSAKGLLKFGVGYTFARIFNYVATNGDNYVTSVILGKGSTGLGSYSRAYQLFMYPVQLIGETIDQVLFPLLSQAQDNLDKIRRVFLNGIGTILLLSVPITIVAFIRAEEIVDFVLGSQWGNVVIPLKIMIICLFFRIAYKLGESVLRSVGRVYFILRIQIIYAFVVLIGAYIGTHYGINGVAAAATIAFTMNCIIITISVLIMLNISFSELMDYIIPILTICIITLLLVIPYEKFIYISNSFVALCVFTIYLFSIYIVSYLIVGTRIVNEELKVFIDSIVRNILNMVKKNPGK